MDDWPKEADALAAASQHHRLLFENESVRVLEALILPGGKVALHTHRWPSVHYVLSWSDFVRRDEHGRVMLDTREADLSFEVGQALWSAPLRLHTLENVGDKPLRLISTELKQS